jgi:hypothetical protein
MDDYLIMIMSDLKTKYNNNSLLHQFLQFRPFIFLSHQNINLEITHLLQNNEGDYFGL